MEVPPSGSAPRHAHLENASADEQTLPSPQGENEVPRSTAAEAARSIAHSWSPAFPQLAALDGRVEYLCCGVWTEAVVTSYSYNDDGTVKGYNLDVAGTQYSNVPFKKVQSITQTDISETEFDA